MEDWRLQGQAVYLQGVSLRRAAWRPHSKSWGHDYCAFCGAKFSSRVGDLSEGYTTEDEYHWICPGCFQDFKHVTKDSGLFLARGVR